MITKEYTKVYKLLDKWTRKVYKDKDQPLSEISLEICKIFNKKKKYEN